MNESDLIPKKRPLMGLLMGTGYQEAVTMGEKTITIREGWRDYHTGDKVLIGCPEEGWCVMGKITSVNFYMLGDVPIRDLNDDLFPTVEDAIDGLSRFYQNINESSPVTVLRWNLE